MVITVTLNPALDYVLTVPQLILGSVNRAATAELQCGGKGLNVSIVLHALGIENIALGFTAGAMGEILQRKLREQGIVTDFIALAHGETRINVKLKAQEETDLNAAGPVVEEEALQALFAKLDVLCAGDILVLAGTVPQGLPQNLYEIILKRLAPKHLRVVVDATQDLLAKTLPYHPFLIKPNAFELAELMGIQDLSEAALVDAARAAQKLGAQNVLVSMAGDGAFLLDAAGTLHRAAAPLGQAKNSVGAGDSMVAGFLAGFLATNDFEKALQMGVAAGSATAFSHQLATRAEIETLYDKITVREKKRSEF
ncbi:MAG: 1-phosphofructokinase [Ruthenibacterium sp.]